MWYLSGMSHTHDFRGVSPKVCYCGVTSDEECREGHRRTDENTSVLSGGKRRCKVCQRVKSKDRRDGQTDEQRAYRLEKGRTYQRAWLRRVRNSVLDHYGRKCACCGEDTVEFLAIDHVGGGGNAHRRKINGNDKTGSNAFYRWLIKNDFPSGFQTLCHNCNFAKSAYGWCPHNTQEMLPIIKLLASVPRED